MKCPCCKQPVNTKPSLPALPFGYIEKAIIRELLAVYPEGLSYSELHERVYNGKEPETHSNLRVIMRNIRVKLLKNSSNIALSTIFTGRKPPHFFLTLNI